MPGAGSTKGANWFQEQKDGDGTLLFGSSGSTQFPYLLGDPRVRYEYNDWNPVMATGTGGVAYLNAEAGADFDGSANKLKDMTFHLWQSGGYPTRSCSRTCVENAGHERRTRHGNQRSWRRAQNVRKRRSDYRLPDIRPAT